MSEWGHDFRPDYLRLASIINELGHPPTMACTATATPKVAEEIVARLGLREPERVRSGFDRPNLSFDVLPFDGEGSVARKRATLVAGLKDPENRPAVVYCGTRKSTEEIAALLASQGVNAAAYHAGMPADARTRAPGRVHARRGRRRGGHERVRDGRRQGRRALGLALGAAVVAGGLLPGGRAGGTRRRARAGGPARVALRPRAARALHPRGRGHRRAGRRRSSAGCALTGRARARRRRRSRPDPARGRRTRGRARARARERAAASACS